MVVHVTVCAIQSRILRCPSINVKDLLDPLRVRLLLLHLKLVNLSALQLGTPLDCPDRGVRIEISNEQIDVALKSLEFLTI